MSLTDIRLKETRNWLTLGFAMSISIGLSFVLSIHHTEEFYLKDVIGFFLLVYLAWLPASLPHFATTLLLQEDLEHLEAELTKTVDAATELAVMELLEKVSHTKRRWMPFLRWHFALEGTGAAACVFAMLWFSLHTASFAETDSRLGMILIPAMLSGPLLAVYVLVQVLSLARFNGHIQTCIQTTSSNCLFRLLSQQEKQLEFCVLGITITLGKIRAVMTSVVISACSKIVMSLVTR